MKYTVIVPVFNGEDTIEDCLRSLIHQKSAIHGEDYTILVVDDGSTDNTARIVGKFPVELIRLPQNEGRIVARLTGAKNARTSRILFVDARVTVTDDTIAKLEQFDDYPAVIGYLHPEEAKYDSILHTILYLIRRRYYGKEFFPMQADELLITEKNFRRAPKGTAVFLVDRDLFVELTPERTGKDVNDDTLLFHNLVFKNKINLFRPKKLFFRYSQRTNLRQFSSWLFHRGVRFSDFYLRPGGYFHIPFLFVMIMAGAALITALLALIINPKVLFYILGIFCVLNAAFSIYLAENRRDLFRAFIALPLIVAIFGSGIAAFWVRILRAKWCVWRT